MCSLSAAKCLVLCAAATAGHTPAVCSMPLHTAQRTFDNDIRSVNASDVGACCASCEAEPLCMYFEFVIAKQLCWLKTSGAGKHTRDEGCVSGGSDTPPAPTPPPPCHSDADCNLCGSCDQATGACLCDPGSARGPCTGSCAALAVPRGRSRDPTSVRRRAAWSPSRLLRSRCLCRPGFPCLRRA